ncbi:MAG: peptide chain release factor N(5)-glutamine methyltransferase [Bacteroidales bacterium]|nr:peptide chain release factor N(5)-glutamine methyltransferase [Bacteroidales bacterium]
MKISYLRTLFQTQLALLYHKKEIDAIFFTYLYDKYNIKKYHYFLDSDACIDFEQSDIKMLTKGCPIQYVTGKTTFCNIELNVNPSVLIPRPETEELTAMIVEKQKTEKKLIQNSKFKTQNSKILDLGTGSGAIAIALAKSINNATVWATDISEQALETAKKNAEQNNVKVIFFQHDILQCNIETLGAKSLPDNFDIIVSNPPYIPQSERSLLHKNIVGYEPEGALFVPDDNPLVFYIAIADTAKKILRKGGVLYFEIHEIFASEVREMLSKKGFKEVELWNDINGKPRFVCAKKL